jgi:hypothetical protein
MRPVVQKSFEGCAHANDWEDLCWLQYPGLEKV